jgi:rhodanese-related sulfurtransferase
MMPQQGMGMMPQQGMGMMPQQGMGMMPQQGMPGMNAGPPPFGMQGGTGGQPPGGQQQAGNPLEQMANWERQDLGVPAPKDLHAGEMHASTPNQIPGGQVITSLGLVSLMQSQQTPFLIFDVLGGPQRLPGAILATPASQPGSFNDGVQQQLGQYLQSVTNGNREIPLIFYCGGLQCWLSYNAALRAINLGYTNVLWYRGGLEAWLQAGLPTEPQY